MTDVMVASEAAGLLRLQDLRKPFPREAVGLLPKGGAMLDYVGHAAVTDRLLTVDPAWNWEPLAVDEAGLPLYDKAGGLWIKLTVLGVTRLGYGDGPDPKQRIGDALRNAAMRFGVALDLWTRDELESLVEPPATPAPAPEADPVIEQGIHDLKKAAKAAGLNTAAALFDEINPVIGRDLGARWDDLTIGDIEFAIEHLEEKASA